MKIHTTGQHQIEKQESSRFRFWSYAIVVPSTVSSTQCTINICTLKNWPYKNAKGRKQYVQMFRKGVSLYSLCGERLQLIAYRWEGCWLAILRIPNLKALKKKKFYFSWFCGWFSASWCWLAQRKLKDANVLIHPAGSWYWLLAGSSLMWDFTWPFACPHTVALQTHRWKLQVCYGRALEASVTSNTF